MYNRTILDNGIKVLTEEINEFKSATIGLWVHTGPKNETKKIKGVSHFIEHMMFKGTPTLTATDIAETMDSVGGHLNAFTEKEQTCYYTKVMDKHIALSIDLLSDMFLNSLFDKIEIERERGVILEEIRMYEDSPDDIVFEEFNHTLWNDHALACPTLGSREVVAGLGRDDFIRYLKNFYTPDNITLAAAGHFKHEDIVELVKKNFGEMKGTAKPTNETLPEFYTRNKLRYKDCEQTYLCLGGKGIPQKNLAQKFPFFILDGILGGSMSSRLFQEIRERRGLVYTVSTFTNSYKDASQFGIYACTSKENLSEVIKLANNILDDLRDNGITEKEMIRMKEHIKGGISLGLESTSNRMMRLNNSDFYHGRMIPIEEVINKVEEATLEEVNKTAKQLLDRKRFSSTILGPLKDPVKEIEGEWKIIE
ncbi:MAG: insulinase family protein [Candidatus Eremiobacteraeota bacterium]|nr:insulinase family protein [Candidatus Eremiobacteraeota bacterium]